MNVLYRCSACKVLLRGADDEMLYKLIEAVLKVLLMPGIEKLNEGRNLLKTLNTIMINILENSNIT